MATITKEFGQGGANLAPGGGAGAPSLADALRDIADDFETFRTTHNAVLTKLDADAGVTDTNYSALHAIAANAVKTKKG